MGYRRGIRLVMYVWQDGRDARPISINLSEDFSSMRKLHWTIRPQHPERAGNEGPASDELSEAQGGDDNA
jgi:hypothetical protein